MVRYHHSPQISSNPVLEDLSMSMYRKTLMAGIAAMAIVSGYGDKQLSPFSSAQAADAPKADVPKVFSFKAKTLEGETADLSKYAGKVVVFVNV